MAYSTGLFFLLLSTCHGQLVNTLSRSPKISAQKMNQSPSEYTNMRAEFIAGLNNEDVKLSIGELILKYGYPLEEHEVLTEDGYILTMFRIPGKGPVVLLMHGLFGSADDFVVAGPKNSLAYLLANDGYDVWLGNARGNKHSRRHVSLDPAGPAFWKFSWHEIGYYDLPAMIDYSLNMTNRRSLYYIGHSQGTTTFFVMGSERPEYNEKVILMIALAPSAYLSNTNSQATQILARSGGLIKKVLNNNGIYELLSDTPLIRIVKNILCDAGPVADILCNRIVMSLNIFSYTELNATLLPVIFSHAPSGASIGQVNHYLQGIVSGDFRQYDHGPDRNMKKYGRVTPPSYPLAKISAPVALFFSDSDLVCSSRDVYKLRRKLSNCVDMYKIPNEYHFGHVDFIWAKHFRNVIYKRIIKLLKTHV
ncbi:lipase 1-like [Galleria mellonella]|uniref:Lipase n=1 Tax=Galleria mellonella TaxID=7137 RepID=A0A6J3CA55_GALME|nr:lipase 1-like [Galleria mellonella]